jgi:hypothetical protein
MEAAPHGLSMKGASQMEGSGDSWVFPSASALFVID